MKEAEPVKSTPSSVVSSSPSNVEVNFERDVFPRLTKEMQDLYQEVKEYEESGQDSMAIKGYETLLRLAEKRNDGILVQFFRKKLENL